MCAQTTSSSEGILSFLCEVSRRSAMFYFDKSRPNWQIRAAATKTIPKQTYGQNSQGTVEFHLIGYRELQICIEYD